MEGSPSPTDPTRGIKNRQPRHPPPRQKGGSRSTTTLLCLSPSVTARSRSVGTRRRTTRPYQSENGPSRHKGPGAPNRGETVYRRLPTLHSRRKVPDSGQYPGTLDALGFGSGLKGPPTEVPCVRDEMDQEGLGRPEEGLPFVRGRNGPPIPVAVRGPSSVDLHRDGRTRTPREGPHTTSLRHGRSSGPDPPAVSWYTRVLTVVGRRRPGPSCRPPLTSQGKSVGSPDVLHDSPLNVTGEPPPAHDSHDPCNCLQEVHASLTSHHFNI